MIVIQAQTWMQFWMQPSWTLVDNHVQLSLKDVSGLSETERGESMMDRKSENS
jgi:hypothetical protein